MDPVLGVVGDYSTDPALLHARNTAQARAALLLDAPTTYINDAFKFSVLPSFRVGDSRGYSSLTSDYEHLSSAAEFDTERSVSIASIGVGRDSSLAYDYLTTGSAGERRDSETADLNWGRHLTERLEFDADASAQEIRFHQSGGLGTLVNYEYSSITPTLSWNSSERNKLTLGAAVSRYDSLDSPLTTESRSANLQIGFVRQLSELWSVAAAGGYSRALNHTRGTQEFALITPFGRFVFPIPVNTESAQNGSVYSVNVGRQGTLLTLNAIASRQLTASAYGFLGRQDTYELKANYSLTERWSFGGDARDTKYQNPLVNGAFAEVSVKSLGLNANWHWTEHWTATLATGWVTDKIQPANINVASTEVSLTLSRQFDHITF